jgi:hypothetical protein
MYEMSAPLGFLDAKQQRSRDVPSPRGKQRCRQACSWQGHAISRGGNSSSRKHPSHRRVPAGNAFSRTHCWPPQSNDSSSSERPTLYLHPQRRTGSFGAGRHPCRMQAALQRSHVQFFPNASRGNSSITLLPCSCNQESTYPELRRQKSASAALMRATQALSSGPAPLASSSSRSCANVSVDSSSGVASGLTSWISNQ